MLWNIAQPLWRLMSAFGDFHDRRNSAPTWPGLILVGLLSVAVAGCDPMLERKYMDEGAGATLYTSDQANQAALLDEYFQYLCLQAAGRCDFVTLVQAGMNDIDQRCDGYLTWLDARRRDKAPFLAEMAAVQTAAHSIMTVTGSNPTSLDILTAAFGLATATYTQWNSRLLVSVEQSTVQDVVYTVQGDYRDKIKTWIVPDRPTAVYLLRNYLRLCMPITIEAKINTTTRLVQHGAMGAAQQDVVVGTMTPTPTMRIARIRSVDAPITPIERPKPRPGREFVGPYERDMQQKDMQEALDIVGCSGTDFGKKGSNSRLALAKFLKDNGKTPSDHVTNDNFFDLRDIKATGKKGNCAG